MEKTVKRVFPKRLTIRDWQFLWEQELQASYRSEYVGDAIRVLEKFLEFIPRRKYPELVIPNDIYRYLREGVPHVSEGRIRSILKILRSYFRFVLERSNLVFINPVDGVQIDLAPQQDSEVMPMCDVERLFLGVKTNIEYQILILGFCYQLQFRAMEKLSRDDVERLPGIGCLSTPVEYIRRTHWTLQKIWNRLCRRVLGETRTFSSFRQAGAVSLVRRGAMPFSWVTNVRKSLRRVTREDILGIVQAKIPRLTEDLEPEGTRQRRSRQKEDEGILGLS